MSRSVAKQNGFLFPAIFLKRVPGLFFMFEFS